MGYKLENTLLELEVSAQGAELQSVKNKRTGFEYLWQGNPVFWKRRSPVLFPIVGAVWDGQFRMDGKTYIMGQHGFARDMAFTPVADCPDDELWFRLESSPETFERFPREFRLEIGYKLDDTRISVMWRVENTDDKELPFQIGAHPAFNMPGFNTADSVHGYFAFDTDNLEAELISEKGCVGDERIRPALDAEGMLPIQRDTFSHDALIFGNSQLHRVSLLDKEKQPLLTVLFRSPYVGLWAPGSDAPFVCIEPWYGRADSVGFEGEFFSRHQMNRLAPGESFNASYMLIIDNI